MTFPHFGYGGQCDLPIQPGSLALECKNLGYRYSNSREVALENIDLKVHPGERVALVGPNGAGKSTLLKVILGIEKPNKGSVTVFGHMATDCHHRVAIVPQSSAIDWKFPVTVWQVVMMGRHVHLGWFKQPRPQDVQAVEEAMKAMNILHLANRQVEGLSGGERQRIMLARTLAHDADLLLLDEPLNHVDISTQEIIFHTLESLSAKGKTTIVSTHDMGVLTVHFSRALFLDKRIIADGSPDKVLTPEIIAKAYGFEFHKDYRNGNYS